ncbi:MAG: hypothetical protein KC560_21200 [Myxococcales bacterium]|nr:hypothetical protein [Myxococcales bacterium]
MPPLHTPPSSNAPPSRDARVALFGRRSVLDALACEGVRVDEVRVARGAPAAARREVEAACRERGVRCAITSVARVHELSRDARHDQGIAARAELLGVHELDALEELRGAPPARARWLALDGVTNAQNAGMIVRSAVAAGIDGILWPRHGTPWIQGLVVKASAGAVLRARIARCDALADALAAFRAAGFQTVGLDARGAVDVFAAPLGARSVHVVGGETVGISERVRDQLDETVRIPMAAGSESLNAAVAAAIVAFHVCRSPQTQDIRSM